MRSHFEKSLPDSLERLRHLNEHETAALVNLSVKTLRRHRFNGTGIPYHKTGRRVSYSLQDIQAWLAGNRIETRN